jgi:ubiquitin carboxyl-terminal hydrolase 36/42
MNDEMVTPISGPPVSKKTAYILFYIRDKGQGLQAVLKGNEVGGVHKEKEKEGGGLLAGMKKRRERDEDVVTNTAEEEDLGERVDSPPPVKFIGPLLPSPMDRSPTKKVKTIHNFASAEDVKEEKKTDPQAEKVKRKIEAAKAYNVVKARSALALLESYDSSDEGSDRDEDVVMNGKSKRVTKARVLVESDDDGEDGSDKFEDQGPKPPSSPVSQFSGKQVSSPISGNNFYGPTQPSGKKGSTPHVNGRTSLGPSKSRTSDDEDEPSPDKASQRYQDHSRQEHRVSMGSPGKKHSRRVMNPYIQMGSGNNSGRINTYGKRNQWKRPKARGV